jgi:hypothetical protein
VIRNFGLVLLLAASALFGQQNGTPVSMVVTAEARRGKTVPAIEQQDLIVKEAKERRPVTGWKSLADAPTQLLLLIDDSARASFGTEIAGLKQFVQSLPPNFRVAVGYMRNGMTQFTQQFTDDHAAAANAIRLAEGPGGADVSPYDSLTDAVKKWPLADVERKEVLMISSGIEGLGGGFYEDNPYVQAGIQSALKAGIVVYAIYSPSVGHAGHSFWQTSWGQNFLSLLTDQTGGESYYIGMGAPVSFQPFLDEFKAAQQHQYLLTFEAKPENKAGFQPVSVMVEGKDASIAAPQRVWVKAGM